MVKRFSTARAALVVILLLAAQVPLLAYQPEQVRDTVSINRDWAFNYFPNHASQPQFAAPGYDDSSWPAIALPHTWSTYETTRDVHPFIKYPSERDDPYWWKGWGWYRKVFVPSADLEGKRIKVEFDGVQKYSRVYLNGNLVGENKGGFNSFSFDLTPWIKPGEENVLAVEVSNRRDDKFGGIPPMTAGNWNVYGGIYRDARMIITNDVHIPYQGSAEHEGGTFVTTPHVDSSEAVVDIKTWVKNDKEGEVSAELTSIILDPDGKEVTRVVTEQVIPAGEMAGYEQESPVINNPLLWSPETPHVYKVASEVRIDGQVIDAYESPLGFRWFRWDYDTDELYVNEKKIHIHGTNRHQEYPWLGDAMPAWLHREEMIEIRNQLGHNFMRTAHYPNAPFIYDLTDSLGIITAEEVPNIKSIDFGEDIQEQNVRQMIRRDRNHPSIFFWSMGNETDDAADSKWAWEEDTTRILHHRKTENHGDYVTHDHTNLDMENMLRVTIRGWYNRDIKDLEPKNTPEVPKSGQHAGTEEWQHIMARVEDGSIRGRIDKNMVVWLYADHGADREYKNAPLKHVNPKGWTGLYRIPKYMYYLWQANYAPDPMVFVQPHYWRKKYLGTKQYFQVDSNCETVELFVNGESKGVKHPEGDNFHTVKYEDILVEEGTLTVKGYCGEETVSRAVTMAGDPAAVLLETQQEKLPADRSGIGLIKATIVDKDGNMVLNATHPLQWTVAGPATLVGTDLYETDIDKTWAMEGAHYINTPVRNVIRTTDDAGEITVRVESPGLEAGELKLASVEPEQPGASLIRQPGLSIQGRQPVRKDEAYVPEIEYLVELEPIKANHDLQGDSEKEFRKIIRKFILDRSYGVYKQSPAFGKLLNKFAAYLVSRNGELVADDYNFFVTQYNDARTIEEAIDVMNLHPQYTEMLKELYAEQLVTEGKLLDMEEEIEAILALPAKDSKINYFTKSATQKSIDRNHARHWFNVTGADLSDLVLLNYPELESLNEKQFGILFKYMAEVNPAITFTNGQVTDAAAYTIEEDTPLFLPSPEFIKELTNYE